MEPTEPNNPPREETRHTEPRGTGGRTAASGNRLAEFSLRYPVTICMVFVLFFALGVISIFKIPLVMMPAMDWPFLEIRLAYDNATPLQVLESITKPLEEALSTVPGAKRMSSRASSSYSEVELTFGWEEDLDARRAEIRDKIDQIRDNLPDDIEHIWIRNWGTEDMPIIFGRIASGKDLRTAYDFLDLKIKKPIERVPGVAEVEVWGAGRREIDIDLRLDDIKRYRVDIRQLFQRLDDINVNRSLGRVVDGEIRYGAMTQGTLASVTDIENIPVNDRGLRLDDIADIVYDTPPPTGGHRLNGKSAVGFVVRKTSQANTVKVVDGVLAKIEEIGKDPTLEGIDLMLRFNQGEQITKSLTGLLSAGAFGAVLAVLVLICFLRKWGATLVIALAIPFSIISAVGFLYLSGQTLDVFTMLGLMLATGMLVDNAVVVLESIYQKLEMGMDRVSAAKVGTQEVITAVIAATLTSVIIFVPLIFGEQNDFSVRLSHTGIAIIFSLGASLFISLTLIPLAMARLLRMDVRERSAWQQWIVERLDRLMRRRRAGEAVHPLPETAALGTGRITKFYLHIVAWPLRHRVLVGLLFVPALIAGSYWLLMNKVPSMTPDALDVRDVRVSYRFSENFHYVKILQDYVIPVERFLDANREQFGIKDIYSRYNNNSANTQIYFDTDKVDHVALEKIREEITEGLPEIPGAEITLGSQRGENQTGFRANLFGDDPETLEALAQEAKRRLLALPDFTKVSTPRDSAEEEVQVRVRRDLARRYGVSAQSVSQALGIVVRGRQIRGFRTPEGEVDILVQLRPEDRENLNDLRSLVVGAGQDGAQITLEQVSDLRIEKVPGQIRRENRQTITSIRATYTGAQRDVGKQAMSDVLDLLDYPPGYGWSFSFWTNRQDESRAGFITNIVLALFMVYFVMASLFESVAHPFAIMFSLPFAMVGVAGFLYVTNSPFNLMAWIGSIVLIGIVVNNGIVLIDHINNLRRKGMRRSDAVMAGCRERLRPIVMTAATTIVGLIPLAFGQSSVFGMQYFPMARTVMGGLMASTVLTLVVLPTYYTLFDDLAVWVKRTWYHSDPSRLNKTADAVSGD